MTAANIQQLGPHPPNSLPSKLHYSFDFAQQVHLPSSPLQPGPMYFLVSRKCGLFGVCCEGLPQQINYLIEGMASSKGSIMVISLLDHFLEKFGLGEKDVDLHCDNCSGQNKNKFMLWYLAWRVVRGLHTSTTIHFMPAGHTKYAPDWCFGLLKKRFKRCEVHCLADLCHVVQTSTTKGINRAQTVGTGSGQEVVPIYNWQQFFDGYLKPFKGIKNFFHFRFTSDRLWVVFVREKLNDEEQDFQLAYNIETARDRLVGLPPCTAPPGLSADRWAYLHQHIRPYVREGVKDLLCPGQ